MMPTTDKSTSPVCSPDWKQITPGLAAMELEPSGFAKHWKGPNTAKVLGGSSFLKLKSS